LDEVLETFYEQEDVVQALIEENYQRLDRDARRVIEALAVFRKPVPPLAVDYLLEPFAPGLDVPSVMQRLTRTNIVSVDRAAKTVTLHPIDQDYAYSQLPEEDETEAEYTRQALERRAADYYVQLRTPEETWKSIDDLDPQLNEFEHCIRAEDYSSAFHLVESNVSKHLVRWGYFRRLIQMRKSIELSQYDPKSVVQNLIKLGHAYQRTGQLGKAITCQERAAQLASANHWLSERSEALNELGHVNRLMRKFGRAEHLHQEALTCARAVKDRLQETMALARLGLVYAAQWQYRRSIRFYEEALKISRDLGRGELTAVILNNIGNFYYGLGKFKESLVTYSEALSIVKRMGNRPLVAGFLSNIGRSYLTLGKIAESQKCLEISLEIGRETGSRLWEGLRMRRLGKVYYHRGENEYAHRLYEKSLSITKEIGDSKGQRDSSLGMGKALLANGDYSSARSLLRSAWDAKLPKISYQAGAAFGVTILQESFSDAAEVFLATIQHCQSILDKTVGLFNVQYVCAWATTGQAVCDPRWEDESERPDLLAPALEEYRRALDITAAPGVVQDAIRDLELIQAAGIEGLEPAFELLENAEYKPDLPEDLPDILEHIKSA
jgi:tetratricopeptide (TPR) repeat protein